MTENPDDGPPLSEDDHDVLAFLDFTPTCAHVDCRDAATHTLHVFHRSPYGLGIADECIPSRYGYCAAHARAFMKHYGRHQPLRCETHELPVRVRMAEGPPA